MQSHDGAHRGINIGQRNHHGAITHGTGQGLAMFGSDYDVNPQPLGGSDEVRSPVRGGGQ